MASGDRTGAFGKGGVTRNRDAASGDNTGPVPLDGAGLARWVAHVHEPGATNGLAVLLLGLALAGGFAGLRRRSAGGQLRAGLPRRHGAGEDPERRS